MSTGPLAAALATLAIVPIVDDVLTYLYGLNHRH